MLGVYGCNVRGLRGGVTRRACAEGARGWGLRAGAGALPWFVKGLYILLYVCVRLWFVHFAFEFGAGSARAALQLVAQAQDAPERFRAYNNNQN